MLLRSITQSLPNPVTVAVEKPYSFSLPPRRIRSPFFGLVVLGAFALLFRFRHSPELSQDRLPVDQNILSLTHSNLPVTHTDSHNDLPLSHDNPPVTHNDNDLPLTDNDLPLTYDDLPLSHTPTTVPVSDTTVLVTHTTIPVSQNDTPVSQDDLPVSTQVPPTQEEDTRIPRFYGWHDREKQLPQNDPDLPYPQGREGRYIRFSNQVWGAFSLSYTKLVTRLK